VKEIDSAFDFQYIKDGDGCERISSPLFLGSSGIAVVETRIWGCERAVTRLLEVLFGQPDT
jgi:hypothetical protein